MFFPTNFTIPLQTYFKNVFQLFLTQRNNIVGLVNVSPCFFLNLRKSCLLKVVML
jgi:hypothetical protein